MPASRYPRWRSLRMTRRLIFWTTSGNVGIAGRLALDKARLEALVGAIEIDTLKEDHMIMHIEIEAHCQSAG